MKMKKIATIALAGVLTVTSVLGFAGCGSSEGSAESTGSTESTESTESSESASAEDSTSSGDGTVYKVGICQLVQHEALDSATEGFQDGLTEVLGEGSVEFDLQNAAGDSATCSTIVNQFVSNGVDLIMANATPSLQAATQATADIPIIATSVTDYATALDISDWKGTTGMNVTGTSDLAPLEDQAKMIQEMVPDAKKVGILYCSAEANSKYQATTIKGYLDELGLESKEYTCADTNDVALVTQTACDENDVLYIPTDNTMASSTEIINSVAEPAGIPIITGEEGICVGCGIGTLSISYYSLGYKTGQMAAEILKDGKDPADMEIAFADELTKEYDADRCEALGIQVPEGYEAIKTEE